MLDSLRIHPAFPERPPTLNLDGSSAVLTHPDTGLGYRLNATGVALWEGLRKPTTVRELNERLASEFDVAPAESAGTVEEFVQRMWELGFVELHEEGSPLSALRRRYLDLLKRALVNLIYPEHELRIEHLEEQGRAADRLENDRILRDIRYARPETFDALVAGKRDGRNWRQRVTRYSHTMIGVRRLENLQWCAARVFASGVPGDFLEAGVCQGGAAIFLRALQVAYDEPHRRMWVADSFQGLPVPTADIDRDYDFSEGRQPWLAVSEQAVRDNFRTYDLLSDQVQFLPGWFSDTLPQAPVEQLAILRLDADIYTSTREVLESLYEKVSPGGFVIVDDYHAFHPCRQAVDSFRAERGIDDPMTRIDWTAVYWQKRG